MFDIFSDEVDTDYLDGKGPNRIAKEIEKEGILNWNGKAKNYFEYMLMMLLSHTPYFKGGGEALN